MIAENANFETPSAAIPAELRTRHQWVAWRYEERHGKRTKPPIDAKGNGKLAYAKSNDPATWSDFATALQACGLHPELAGVGFCFAPGDGLTGLDLDHVIDAETGELKREAAEIVARFKGTYIEVSPSGTGIRVFCYGKPIRSGKNTGPVKWLEVYAHPSHRYLTVTGNPWPGSAPAVTDQQAALDWLHGRWMQQDESTGSRPVDSKPSQAPLNMDDATLLDKARRARNGAEFERLWNGDAGNDHSAADLALCNLLAFYTGNDAARMDRLFRQSGLFRPGKWDKVHFADGRTYGQATLERAIAGSRETYKGKAGTTGAGTTGTTGAGAGTAGAGAGTAETKAQSAIAPLRRFTAAELAAAELHPKCIVEKYLYRDVALVAAAGGTGKTTMLIWEAVHIALGRDLWGCRVVTPGATLFVTAEDDRELFAARLREVMDAMRLSEQERATAINNVIAWDVTGELRRLAELGKDGNIILTDLADAMVAAYQGEGIVQIVFDPAISFGPGERMVNDGEQAVVTACRRIMRGLDCCVRLVHHSGKANARAGALDQYAARGGTALPDGCRMVAILSPVNENGHCAAIAPEGFDLQPGESGFILARAKLSYCPPQPNIWIRRRGFEYEYFIEQPRNSDAARERDADKVVDFLEDELHHGRKYTARSLEDSGKLKLSRASLRAALANLETTGRIEERELPQGERRGKRKTYLHPLRQPDRPAHCASHDGAIEPENTPCAAPQDPIAPPIAIAPSYRERENGAIDRRFSHSPFLNAPKLNGAIAAQWRNSEELPPNEPPSLPVDNFPAGDAGELWNVLPPSPPVDTLPDDNERVYE